MDMVLVTLSVFLLLIGLAGCLLPVVPGPPFSFLALLLVNFSGFAQFKANTLLIIALITIAVTIMDFYFPVWSTKRLGGTKYGMWGAGTGVLAGLFLFPPVGLIIGPLAGAILGELLGGSGGREALVSGLGSFAGFLLGVGLKLITSLAITVYFVKEVFL